MTFNYDNGLAIDSVNDVLADLTCDTTYIVDLAKVMSTGDYTYSDLEEDFPNEYECYDNIVDEVYSRLTDNEIIPEDFAVEFPSESNELGDYIDDSIELLLEQVIEMEELLADVTVG